jgi:hypothetical protein
MEPGGERPHDLGPHRHVLGFAVLCAAFGIVAGMVVWYMRGTSVGYEEFPVYSGAASFIAGGLAWRVLFRGGRRPGPARGAVAGVLAALLGHYLTFVVSIEIANAQYWVFGRKVTWSDDAPVGPLLAFAVSPLYALVSLAMLGWLTLPSGAILGALFGHALRRGMSPPRGATTSLLQPTKSASKPDSE